MDERAMASMASNQQLHEAHGEPYAVARRLAEAFRAEGEELYLVGGAVRDRLLGIHDLDIDLATSALPDTIVRIGRKVGLGKPHLVGEKFGTVGLETESGRIEITTYRSEETYLPGSRKPSVKFGSTLLDDLSRRDFTINAMAQDLLTGAIVDPLRGKPDLEAGLIRAVEDPLARFREDPLRLLRGVRLASRLAFTIEGQTWHALERAALWLETISRERIRDEYTKILTGPDPVRGLTLLRESTLLQHSVPELLELTQMQDHGPRHPLSLWDHTMRVLAEVPAGLTVRWAALLHDIAKPATRTHEPSGRPRFFHHEELGSRMAREILWGLRYSNQVVEAVSLLIETHMQLHSYSPEWSDGAVRRLMLRLGPSLGDAILLARADAAGHAFGTPSADRPKFDHLEARIRDLDRVQVETLQSPLTGHDLMQRYQRAPGPWIRHIKDTLREEVLEGHLAPDDRDAAWMIADRLIASDA